MMLFLATLPYKHCICQRVELLSSHHPDERVFTKDEPKPALRPIRSYLAMREIMQRSARRVLDLAP
jgi:hypothetical protein